MFKLVEKSNHNALHGLFDTIERAEHHLEVYVPHYCERGYFMDKTLTPDDFEIISAN